MNERQPTPAIDPMDLRVLGYFVRKHLALGLPDDFIDQVLEQAQAGNGPAEYIVASWWETLSYDSQARHWFASSASHNHAPAFEKLRSQPKAQHARKAVNKRIAG
jgi:hypothetical protein